MQTQPEILLTRDEASRARAVIDKAAQVGAGAMVLRLHPADAKRAVTVTAEEDGAVQVVVTCAGQQYAARYASLAQCVHVHGHPAAMLFDDGEFFITALPHGAGGLLNKRLPVGVDRHGNSSACVGQFQRGFGECWRASIHSTPDEDSDCIMVYDGQDHTACVAELWARRHQAFFSPAMA